MAGVKVAGWERGERGGHSEWHLPAGCHLSGYFIVEAIFCFSNSKFAMKLLLKRS